MVNGVSHGRQRPDQVQVQQFSPHRRFAGREGADHPATGDGDDRIQAAQRVDRSPDAGVERVEVGDVTLDTDRALTEFGTQRRESIVASGQHRYRCSASHQRAARQFPNTAGGTGDEDAATSEVNRNGHAGISPSRWSPYSTNKR
jgi:hypothetical protein